MKLPHVLFLIASLLVVSARAIPLPSEPEHRKSLDGTWRFKLEGAAREEQFQSVAFKEDGSWSDIKVPGNWEMAGFSPATYAKLGNDVGLYRVWFEVPESWRGRLVKVNFDAVQNGAEVFINGEPANVDEPSWGRANYHESGWTAFQADVTPHVKFGEKNLLALRVAKNTKSAGFDCGDYFYLGGIHRSVTLFSIPKEGVRDLTVDTSLLPDGKAQIRVAVVPGGDVGISVSLDGEEVHSELMDAGVISFKKIVEHPRLWSAEHPELYTLNVELTDAKGATLERITRRIGIREISTTNGVLKINGVPVKLAGICRHDIYPSMGSAVNEEVWKKDIALMKAANINAIRTSHYPYGEGFYDLCDEMGMYVVDEMPDFQRPSDEPAMQPAFVQRTREMVRRDKNHPCVIIWTVANEVKKGRNLQACVDELKRMDPTRPTIVSQMPAELYGTQMDDLHYPTLDRMDKDGSDKERRAKWPVVYLEHPNNWDVRLGADAGCWDRFTIGLQRVWSRVMKYDGMAGTFLWEWQDRAISDNATTKPYEYDPETKLQYFKLKGIVDGWRHPRAWHYDLKMVYSPIQVVKADTSGWPAKVMLCVSNRYSFTNLSELETRWKLLKGEQVTGEGVTHLPLAPRSEGDVELALPKESADAVRVEFNDPRGWNVMTYEVRVAPPDPPPSVRRIDDLTFPQFNLVNCKLVNDKVHWKKVTRTHATLANVKVDPPSDTPLEKRRLNEVRSVEADVQMGEKVVGHLSVTNDGGSFKYRVDWTGERIDVQELGWIFDLPKPCDRFSWRREGAWTVYPDKHIGRLSGTAHPDSASVHYSDNSREDAFDFTATKYDCDWAALSDGKGSGVLVQFDPERRQHVKGGLGAEGRYQLIVNKQVSPPRDFGTPIVKDLYLELSKGQSVEGSFTIAK